MEQMVSGQGVGDGARGSRGQMIRSRCLGFPDHRDEIGNQRDVIATA